MNYPKTGKRLSRSVIMNLPLDLENSRWRIQNNGPKKLTKIVSSVSFPGVFQIGGCESGISF